VAHGGRRSIRLAGGPTAPAHSRTLHSTRKHAPPYSQRVVQDPCGPGASFTGKVKIKVETFQRWDKPWKPKRIGEEEPRETFIHAFAPAAQDWSHLEATITPQRGVKRLTLEVILDATNGVAWVDDLALFLVNAAAAPSLPNKPVEPQAKNNAARDALTELDSSSGQTDAAGNLLRNPGFEELVTNAIVTVHSDRPSPYRPSDTPNYLDENDAQQQRYLDAPPPPEADCAIIDSPPTIDGKLDDACWQKPRGSASSAIFKPARACQTVCRRVSAGIRIICMWPSSAGNGFATGGRWNYE